MECNLRKMLFVASIFIVAHGCIESPLLPSDEWICRHKGDANYDMDKDGDWDWDDYELYHMGKKGDPGKDAPEPTLYNFFEMSPGELEELCPVEFAVAYAKWRGDVNGQTDWANDEPGGQYYSGLRNPEWIVALEDDVYGDPYWRVERSSEYWFTKYLDLYWDNGREYPRWLFE